MPNCAFYSFLKAEDDRIEKITEIKVISWFAFQLSSQVAINMDIRLGRLSVMHTFQLIS